MTALISISISIRSTGVATSSRTSRVTTHQLPDVAYGQSLESGPVVDGDSLHYVWSIVCSYT